MRNSFIRSWSHLPSLFTHSYISSLADVYRSGPVAGSGELSYRPLVTLSYMIDHSVWGLRPEGYHLTSLVLHTLNVVLVFFLGLRLLKHRGAAFLAAVLFAVHPVNAEAVSIISYRSDLLAAAFFLSAFIAYLRFRDSGSRAVYAGSRLLFSAALLSKENAVAFPFALLCYEGFLEKDGLRKKIKTLAPYFVLMAFYLVLWAWMKTSLTDQIKNGSGQTFWTYAAHLAEILGSYARILVFPSGLHLTLAGTSAVPVSKAAFFRAVFLFAALAAAAGAVRKSPFAAFCFLWFFVCLAPFFPALFLSPSRYLYLPALGFFWAVSAGAAKLFGHSSWKIKTAALLSFAALCAVFIRIDLERMRVMKKQVSCAEELVRYYPDNSQARILMASSYRDAEDWNAMLPELQKARQLEPPVYEQTYVLSGIAFYNLGRMEESRVSFETARSLNPKNSLPYLWLGSILGKKGDLEGAADDFRKALALDPEDPVIYFNLGVAYFHLHRLKDAAGILTAGALLENQDSLSLARFEALKQAIRQAHG